MTSLQNLESASSSWLLIYVAMTYMLQCDVSPLRYSKLHTSESKTS